MKHKKYNQPDASRSAEAADDLDMDAILKKALHDPHKPDPALFHKIKYELVKETKHMNRSTIRRSFGTVAVACMILMLASITAFAAVRFLTPGEIAYQLGDQRLSMAFEGEGTININESVSSGGYRFTLLSFVSGNEISDSLRYAEGLSFDRTYLVVAIEREDGDPMATPMDDGFESFYISPYIRGYMPWQVNLHTLEGGHIETVIDGVRYRIIDMENIKAFAGHGIYIGVNVGWTFNRDAFIFNADPWELKSNPDFDGPSVVFRLPIDISFADPTRADEILSEIPFLQRDLFHDAHDVTDDELAADVIFEVAPPCSLYETLFEDRPHPGEGRFWMDYDCLRARADERMAELRNAPDLSAATLAMFEADFEREFEHLRNGFWAYGQETPNGIMVVFVNPKHLEEALLLGFE